MTTKKILILYIIKINNLKKINNKNELLLDLCMKENHDAIGNLIFAEFSLKNSDINIVKSKNIEKITSNLFTKYLTDNNNCCN